MQLDEDNRGRLSGTAKLGKRSLPSPEYFLGEGAEGLRRLTWRFVFKGFCYYLSYTVSQRFAVSQIAVNGFPVCQKKHGMFQQVCNMPVLTVKQDPHLLLSVHSERCLSAVLRCSEEVSLAYASSLPVPRD